MICDSCNGDIEYADDAYGVVTQSVKDVPTSPGAVRKLFCAGCAARHYRNDQAKLVEANRIALEHLRVTGRLPTPEPKDEAKLTKPWWKLGGLFSRIRLFGTFSDDEKRAVLDWNIVFLQGERGRRNGTVSTIDFTGANALANRLSDDELNCLIKLRQLIAKADATSGSQAIALYKKIAKLAPWDEICVMSIGVEYAKAGKFTKAIQWLKKSHALNPNNDRVRQNLHDVKVQWVRSDSGTSGFAYIPGTFVWFLIFIVCFFGILWLTGDGQQRPKPDENHKMELFRR